MDLADETRDPASIHPYDGPVPFAARSDLVGSVCCQRLEEKGDGDDSQPTDGVRYRSARDFHVQRKMNSGRKFRLPKN